MSKTKNRMMNESEETAVQDAEENSLMDVAILPPALWHVSLAKHGFPRLEGEVRGRNREEAVQEFYRQKGIVRSEKDPDVRILEGSVR